MYLEYNFIGDINDITIGNLINWISSHNGPIKHLQLNISSLGGSVSPAITIYNFLKRVSFPVTTHNLGEVTSAAIIMYLSGRERTAEKISKFVINPVKGRMNGDLSYYQLQELVQLLDADIENYASIVNQETNSLNDLYNLEECLKSKSISLNPSQAWACGIITQTSE